MAHLPIQAVVHYPTQAQSGVSYLMTVDLAFDPQQPTGWTLNREEIALECYISSSLFTVAPPADPTFILHRYGGTYGSLTFLLKAQAIAGRGEIHLTLFEDDLPIGDFALAAEVVARADVRSEVQVGYVATTTRTTEEEINPRPEMSSTASAETETTATTAESKQDVLDDEAQSNYFTIDILITRSATGYTARVLASPVGEARIDFVLPFTERELSNAFWFGDRSLPYLSSAIEADTPPLSAKTFGTRLYDAVFGGQVRRVFLRSLDMARLDDAALRIRLRLSEDVPELATLPWEYLYSSDQDSYLSLSLSTPLVRYVELPTGMPIIAIRLPLRILVITASPTDMFVLDVEREWRQLQEALADLQNHNLVVLERLAAPTLSTLQAALRRSEIHVLHFIGHGAFDPKQNTGGLVFEDEAGRSHLVDVTRLATLLSNHRSLSLVFLNASWGAKRERSDFAQSVARRLVQHGIANVLAMQFPVSDRVTVTLVHEFYAALADGYPLDLALTEARKAMYVSGGDYEWGAPALISRMQDYQIVERSTGTGIERQSWEPETVLIKHGSFFMGSDHDEPNEAPRHTVVLPDFRMGKYPVTNKQYAEFLARNPQQEEPKRNGWFLRSPPNGKEGHPVVGVSWDDALAYCRWLSTMTGRAYRLPTEAEWERAARGTDDQRYPWGSEWVEGAANVGSTDTTAVTAHPDGASPDGCLDMLGNVQEWTGTLWGRELKINEYPYPYRRDDGREEINTAEDLSSGYRVHRGGSFRNQADEVRCSARTAADPSSKVLWRGFRVVMEVGAGS